VRDLRPVCGEKRSHGIASWNMPKRAKNNDRTAKAKTTEGFAEMGLVLVFWVRCWWIAGVGTAFGTK